MQPDAGEHGHRKSQCCMATSHSLLVIVLSWMADLTRALSGAFAGSEPDELVPLSLYVPTRAERTTKLANRVQIQLHETISGFVTGRCFSIPSCGTGPTKVGFPLMGLFRPRDSPCSRPRHHDPSDYYQTASSSLACFALKALYSSGYPTHRTDLARNCPPRERSIRSLCASLTILSESCFDASESS